MFCAKCGKQLDDSLKFCTACGAKVRVKSENVESTTEVATESTTIQESNKTAVENAVSEADTIENDGAVEKVAPSSNESPSISEMETSVIQTVSSPNDISADATTVLPASALEPTTTTPSYETQYVPNAYVAPQPTATYVQPVTAQAVNPVVAQISPAAKRRGYKKAIAISSVAAVVVVAAVGVLFALGVFNPATPIDAESFPNDIIRGAVLDQLDEDGDGRLSSEEANEVTALVYTSEGAKFVTGGEEVDVSRVREEISKDAEAYSSAIGGAATSDGTAQSGDGATNNASTQPNTSASNANNASNESSIGMGTVTTIKGIDMFPNIKTLIASDSKLYSIDISELPQIEYVDLRGNEDLSELDLSNNPNIKVLFCDPDTKLTGLEEAGLYYTDLITGMSFSKSYPQPIEVEYDSHARPIKANGYKFTYDESGRLIKEESEDLGNGTWYSEFAYGENGLPTKASRFTPLDVDANTFEYAYGYNDRGELSQFASGNGESKSGRSVSATFKDAGVFAYVDGKLTSYQATDRAILFKMNDSGMFNQAISGTDSSQISIQCSYDPSGSMSLYHETSASLEGDVGNAEYKTEYSAEGTPIKTTTKSGYTVTYKCNTDGYITEINWSNGDFYMAGQKGRISYVKRVGRLTDRASERFVPTIMPIISQDWVLNDYNMFGPEDWFCTTATDAPVTVMVIDPRKVVEVQTGLFPNMLYNPNEVALAAYDREHWTDGLNLSGEQPITSDGVSKLLEKAAKTALPVPAQTFLDDKVYGPVIQQYISAIKEARTGNNNSSNKYNMIPELVYMSVDAASYSYDEYENLLKVIDAALVDLNSDGINELAITLPSQFKYSETEDDTNSDVLAVYAQKDGKAELVASGGDKYFCWIASTGDVVTYISTASYYADMTLFSWNGSESVKSGGIGYVETESDSSKYVLTILESNGSKKTETVSRNKALSKMDEYWKKYKRTKLNWTPIPIS